jgi:mono/diheme cytochrome c family protein
MLLPLVLLLQAVSGSGEELPNTQGKAVLIRVCGSCHAPEVVVGTNNTRRGWSELVDEMIEKGAHATSRERRQIIDYLAHHFPMRPDKP